MKITGKELEKLLKRASLIGGKRLVFITEILAETDKIPLNELEALRYRHVGPWTLGKLKELGLVDESFSGLSVRAMNCLDSKGIHTKEQAKQEILDGRLTYENEAKIRNYGWYTHREVCRWVGLPDPRPPKYMRENTKVEIF
jgi:hypothetical protein